ncbi:MAG TPA: type VI secretion system accessory protein TagJ [Isosphaeraceae bacterium]|nr:type VI secretion system accessory protein TagJ [Isosphaeraceae bacterium]
METGTLLYKAGNLNQAIEAQLADVKKYPLDPGQRLFLFDLLLFSGDIERAKRQIEAVKQDSAEEAAGVAMYRQLMESELLRRRLFSDGLAPTFLGDDLPEHVRHRLEAVNRLREGHAAEALQEIEKAEQSAPALSGEVDGKPFSFFRDCDDLFSGILEVMAGGQYLWVPLERVESIRKEPPQTPRDLVYAPATLELKDSAGPVFLPALYPNSHEHAEDVIRLGRATDWKSLENGPVLGVGLREWLIDDEPRSFHDWQELRINPS